MAKATLLKKKFVKYCMFYKLNLMNLAFIIIFIALKVKGKPNKEKR